MTKRTITIMLCCLFGTALFAQNIPADSLDYYRKAAHRLLIDKKTEEAVDLYKRLVLSGDELSGYQLNYLYSQGQGVPKDEVEAQKWQSMAQEIAREKDRQSRTNGKPGKAMPDFNEPQSLEALFHTSGSLIERGAKEKNISYIVAGAGAAVGGSLIGIGISRQTESMSLDGRGAVIAGYAFAGACGVAALVLNIVGNHHIKQGGELMRRVRITGDGVSVSF